MGIFNSTIRIKQNLCIRCGKPCVWFSKKRCQQCAKVEDFYAKEAKILPEDDGLPELIDRLDGLVSKYVRLNACDKDRNCECYTCGDKRLWMTMDAGHYIARSCMYLRFDMTRNIRPQCHICNRSKYGMSPQFAAHLELEMPGSTEILLEESRIIHKWSREELRAMIIEYTAKVKQLKL